jgi:sialic acid synthase SpsE
MKVIAEIGSNWKTLEDCVDSVRAAKRSGADIVKFQSFKPSELYGEGEGEGLRPPISLIANMAQMLGIEFMCTAFSPVVYLYIDPFVSRHKIASSEITDLNILKTVAQLKKPVLVSTGGATLDEIDTALDILDGLEVTLMHCVVSYPARVVDFRHLDELKERYGSRCLYGYSDHSCDVLNIPMVARDRGAVILEKHVNFTSHTDTPDAPHSLNENEFAMMVRNLKGNLSPRETFILNPHKRKPSGDSFVRPKPA